MSQAIYKYIWKHFSDQPQNIDRIIVSAYLKHNQLTVQKNKFLKRLQFKSYDIERRLQVENFESLIIDHFKVFSIETVIELFEFVISPADKVITGAVYTPAIIRNYIVEKCIPNGDVPDHWKAADISCGCGGFLLTMAKTLKSRTGKSCKEIFEQYLYGLDIKSYAAKRSKILLSLFAITLGEDIDECKFNIYVGDALAFKWPSHIINFTGFSAVCGNPPYVCSKRITLTTKKYLKRFEVCNSGHPDLYIPFFQIGIELLSVNGILGYITMNTFIKSLNGRALRAYIQQHQFTFEMIDFGTYQIFKRKSTYTCLCFIEKTVSDGVSYVRFSDLKELALPLQYDSIPYVNLDAKKGWNLFNNRLMSKIENVGIPFSKKYKTRNGIATLKNEIFIFNPITEDESFYYLQNGDLYPIEKGLCKNVVNPNFLTTGRTLESFTEKLIFPYYFEDNQPQLLSGKELAEQFPMAFKYLQKKRSILATRDNGKGNYEKWFAFGRTQSLVPMQYKLFFPHITPVTPHFIINSDPDLFFYNGIAVIGESEEELMVLTKLMSSRIFWYYIKSTSKPYAADFFSLSKNYIQNFGICDLLPDEKKYVLEEADRSKLDVFFEKKYDVEF